MRPLRLAVIFDQQIRAGGGYQQALNAALLARELPADLCEPVFFTTLEENIEMLAGYEVDASLIRLSFFDKAETYLRRGVTDHRLLKILKKLLGYMPFEEHLVLQDIDLVYFLSPSSWARDLEKLNYIITIWDLCHRDDPEFPEVRWNRELEARERNYRSLLPRSTAIFVDSELGRKNVVHRYGIDDERVHVMPFQGATATRRYSEKNATKEFDVGEKYLLDIPYVFYPAQFWAHKNHSYLLEGLKILEDEYNLKVGVIFSGGDQGNLAYVKSYVRKLNLENRVRFVGFINNQEIPELYRQSVALVMPTYFGPTNLPPLEAFEIGVPVLYSDKAGLRDQVCDAALLMDLKNPTSMAKHIFNVINDEGLRSRLIKAGKERLRYFDSMDRVGILKSVLEDFRWRRNCWE